jgi:hypothetical protein
LGQQEKDRDFLPEILNQKSALSCILRRASRILAC